MICDRRLLLLRAEIGVGHERTWGINYRNDTFELTVSYHKAIVQNETYLQHTERY